MILKSSLMWHHIVISSYQSGSSTKIKVGFVHPQKFSLRSTCSSLQSLRSLTPLTACCDSVRLFFWTPLLDATAKSITSITRYQTWPLLIWLLWGLESAPRASEQLGLAKRTMCRGRLAKCYSASVWHAQMSPTGRGLCKCVLPVRKLTKTPNRRAS